MKNKADFDIGLHDGVDRRMLRIKDVATAFILPIRRLLYEKKENIMTLIR